MQSFTATAEEEVETEDYSSFRVKTEKQAQRKKTCQNIREKKSSCSVLAAVVAVTTQHHSVSAEGKLTIKKEDKDVLQL